MSVVINKEDIVQTECRFAVHGINREDYSDIHLVKKAITLKNGTIVPEIGFIKNFQRPFWITKPGERNYKEVKEWIKINRLDRYETTQANLVPAIAKALKVFGYRGSLKGLCQQPYVFGADISSTAIIKHEMNKNTQMSPYSVSVYDTETDVLYGTGEVIINTISFRDKIYTAIKSSFLKGYVDPLREIHSLLKQYLGDTLQKRNATVEIEIFDTEIDCIKACIKKSHEWLPDFIAVWNIEFDMDKIIEACSKVGIKPEDILSHPSVPKEFRHFKFKKGPAKKETASGRVINFKPAQRWHSVDVMCGSVWIDAMQAYRQVRTGSAEETSYALDAILTKHKIPNKLKFKDLNDNDAPAAGSLDWHKFMQEKYPLHYVVYNIYDCIGVELLDEATADLRISFPMFAGCTDFAQFNSLPKKAINELHWECLESDMVISATAEDMVTDGDDETTDVSGWITMLYPHLLVENGLRIIKELKGICSKIYAFAADLDVEGAYPTNTSVMNVSKETTVCELIAIHRANGSQIPEEVVRLQTINFSGGKTNAMEFCQIMFGMPSLDSIVEHYDNQVNGVAVPYKKSFLETFRQWLSSSAKANNHLPW